MRVLKYVLAVVAVLVGLAVALFWYALDRDQKNFEQAKNKCEVGCIQDSGGFPDCRNYCASHPDHYP